MRKPRRPTPPTSTIGRAPRRCGPPPAWWIPARPSCPIFASDKIDRTLFGTITDADLEEARKPLPPTRLQAEPGRRDYDFQGDSKALWEQVAAALHLKVLFDADYKPTRAFRFELTNADYREALHALQAATDSFLVPISQRLIFIANDSTQKRTEFERTAAVVVPFPEAISAQELQEVATSIRGVLDSQKLMVDTTRHLILIRDKVSKVRLAEKLLADLLRPRAQVTIDVEILTTDLSSSLSYGLSLPTSFALSSFLNRANLTNAYIPSGFSTFLAFGGGASLLGLGITNAQLFAIGFQFQLAKHLSCAGGGGGWPARDAACGREIPDHHQRLFWKHVRQRHGLHPAADHQLRRPGAADQGDAACFERRTR